MGLVDYSIEQLEQEITSRKAALRDQERSDQACARAILHDALASPLFGGSILRILSQCPNKASDISLFSAGGAHMFDIAITLIYREDNE